MAAPNVPNRNRRRINHHKKAFHTHIDKTEIEIRMLVLAFFKGDVLKLREWLITRNPLLGNRTPQAMIRQGHGNKLLTWVKEQLAGNVA